MLAYPASAKPIDYSKPTFIQPKLDGVRCVIQGEYTKEMTIKPTVSRLLGQTLGAIITIFLLPMAE